MCAWMGVAHRDSWKTTVPFACSTRRSVAAMAAAYLSIGHNNSFRAFSLAQMSSEVCMSSERAFGPASERLELLGSVFVGLWRLNEAAAFGRLLRRIDDALVQHRSRPRIM